MAPGGIPAVQAHPQDLSPIEGGSEDNPGPKKAAGKKRVKTGCMSMLSKSLLDLLFFSPSILKSGRVTDLPAW